MKKYIKTQKSLTCSNCKIKIPKFRIVTYNSSSNKFYCNYCSNIANTPQKHIKMLKSVSKKGINHALPPLDINIISILKSVKKLHGKYNTSKACILKKYNIPLLLFRNDKRLTGACHNENVLSDALASAFMANDGIYLAKLIQCQLNKSVFPKVVSVQREFTTKIDNIKNSADMFVNLDANSLDKIIIEHKIKHNLTQNQLLKYDMLATGKEMLLIISSKIEDHKELTNFKKQAKTLKSIHILTHKDLFINLLQYVKNGKLKEYAFLLKWICLVASFYQKPESDLLCSEYLYQFLEV